MERTAEEEDEIDPREGVDSRQSNERFCTVQVVEENRETALDRADD